LTISCIDAFSSREPVPTPHPVRGRPSLENALFAILPGRRIVFLVQRFLRSGAVGEIRRRSLIAGRRLRERFAGRLALEFGGLRFVTLEHAHEAALVPELRRAQDRAGARIAARLQAVRTAHVTLARGPAGVELARRQDAGSIAACREGVAVVVLFLLACGDRGLAARSPAPTSRSISFCAPSTDRGAFRSGKSTKSVWGCSRRSARNSRSSSPCKPWTPCRPLAQPRHRSEGSTATTSPPRCRRGPSASGRQHRAAQKLFEVPPVAAVGVRFVQISGKISEVAHLLLQHLDATGRLAN